MRPYLNKVGTKEKVLFNEFKGVYTAFGEEGCPGGFSPFMENISAVSYPHIVSREGREAVGALEGEILYFGVIEGKYLSCVEKLEGVCRWKYFDGEWKEICTVEESDSGKYDMLYFINATILVSGKKYVDNKIEKTISYILTFEEGKAKVKEEKNMPLCDMLDTMGGRICAAFTGGEKVYLGGAMDREVWFDIDDGMEQNMITQNCENISAIKTYGGHLVCFKPHSFGEIYGNTPDSYTMIMVSESMGCIAEKSICDCGRLLWLSEEGILSYGGGSIPKVISAPIQKYIDNFDYERAEECCAGSDGIRYIISMPQKGGGKINCVLNLENGNYWVEDSTDFRFFTNMDGQLYAALSDGRILKMWCGGEDVLWKWQSPLIKPDLLKKVSLRRIYVRGEFFGRVTVRIINNKGESDERNILISEDEKSGVNSFYITLHPALFHGCESFQIYIEGEGRCKITGIAAVMRNRDISY